ncbi:MAG: flagellin [Planctomycetaceae bacterium]|jgi:flagellin|nr:flagellin [Planctomycetaceae bacterium]
MSILSINSISNSLQATQQVQRTQSALVDTLTQLTTGLRINSAKDDPAGLIAQEILRAEITASTAAVKNTQMAAAMLKVAESGLGEINTLLNDAKGLAVEAANKGTMSPEMIEANQTQVNQILNSVNRIAGTTNWLGKSLLDGSLSEQNGGATFQLGTQVISSQQTTETIDSVLTNNIGSQNGKLSDLASGGKAALATNPALASNIIDAAILQIATQRGELGTTQKYTLDSNIASLENSIVQLTGALSQISDADFAVATSELARNQILLGAGIKALGIINQIPQYAAGLIEA